MRNSSGADKALAEAGAVKAVSGGNQFFYYPPQTMYTDGHAAA
jgi:hypothetical protein